MSGLRPIAEIITELLLKIAARAADGHTSESAEAFDNSVQLTTTLLPPSAPPSNDNGNSQDRGIA